MQRGARASIKKKLDSDAHGVIVDENPPVIGRAALVQRNGGRVPSLQLDFPYIYTHPVGLGMPAHLHAERAGPCGKSS